MHAMIITAYRDPAGLKRMVGALARHALCYVHADARSEITQAQVDELNAMENVRAIRRYAVNWGSILHLQALLDLCRMALEDERVTHLHLISAQDFPIVSHKAFEAFFEGDARVHMQVIRTGDFPELEHRYRHYHAMHLINYRDMSDRVQTLVGRIDRFQDALHVRRRLELPYKGLVWMSMPREAARFVLEDKRSKKLLRRLRWTYIPEEFFFQNAFDGSPFEVSQENLRFSLWDEPARGLPALLDTGDMPAICASGCLFARKVNPDTALYEELEGRWLSA